MKIAYKGSVDSDLKRLDKQSALRIIGQLEQKLTASPRAGTVLKGEFAGLYRLRVGDYRVIYALSKDGILVLRIGHRKNVYRQGPPAR